MSTQEGIDRFIAKIEEQLDRSLDDLERTIIGLAYVEGAEDALVDCARSVQKTLGDQLDPGKIR